MGWLDIRPFALLDSDISPFVGIGAGYYVASKGPQRQPAWAFPAGIDISVDYITIVAELRYERSLHQNWGVSSLLSAGILTFRKGKELGNGYEKTDGIHHYSACNLF